jgi:hypothetical protein
MWKSSVVPSEPWTSGAAAFLGFAKCCSAGPQRIRKGAVSNRRADVWQEHINSSDNTAARGVARSAAPPVVAGSLRWRIRTLGKPDQGDRRVGTDTSRRGPGYLVPSLDHTSGTGVLALHQPPRTCSLVPRI